MHALFLSHGLWGLVKCWPNPFVVMGWDDQVAWCANIV